MLMSGFVESFHVLVKRNEQMTSYFCMKKAITVHILQAYVKNLSTESTYNVLYGFFQKKV